MMKVRKINDIITENFTRFDLLAHTILLGYMGSTAHGTQITQEGIIPDKDVYGIAVPPAEYYMGMEKFEQFEYPKKDGTHTLEDPWDITIYELHKIINLLMKNNPNILSLLWLPENMYIQVDKIGRILIEHRKMFASKRAYHSFSGYAYSQLKKMTPDGVNGKMGKKRKMLVKEFGYDTKNAAHLIRLLRMGTEFLVEGELYVSRKDATQLIDIKTGKWTLDQVKVEADKWMSKCEDAYIASSLPSKPDGEAIKRLVFELTRNYLEA